LPETGYNRVNSLQDKHTSVTQMYSENHSSRASLYGLTRIQCAKLETWSGLQLSLIAPPTTGVLPQNVNFAAICKIRGLLGNTKSGRLNVELAGLRKFLTCTEVVTAVFAGATSFSHPPMYCGWLNKLEA
jgi:hypothetical protein